MKQFGSLDTARRGQLWNFTGRSYSDDLRERLVRAVVQGGQSRHQAAAQFGVGISTAINWVRRFQETGSVEPDQIGGYPRQSYRTLGARRPFVAV
jgi:transposase-like protein